MQSKSIFRGRIFKKASFISILVKEEPKILLSILVSDLIVLVQQIVIKFSVKVVPKRGINESHLFHFIVALNMSDITSFPFDKKALKTIG